MHWFGLKFLALNTLLTSGIAEAIFIPVFCSRVCYPIQGSGGGFTRPCAESISGRIQGMAAGAAMGAVGSCAAESSDTRTTAVLSSGSRVCH